MGSGRALRIGPNFFGLRGTFVLSDPEALQATVSELEQAPVLTLFPQVGTYQLELCAQGSSNPACQAALPYELYRLECQDGSSAPELCAAQGLPLTQTLISGAVLTTPNPQTVTIAASQATTTTFALIVPGEGTVAFARGTLNVDLDVTEGFPDGQACTSAVQCQSQVCAGTPPVCQAASCSDGIQNGGETGFDCGGPCTACLVQPNCADGQQNGDEEGVDCGGSICQPCSILPSCSDFAQNGDEEGVDCGGSACPACECTSNAECPSGTCIGGTCL